MNVSVTKKEITLKFIVTKEGRNKKMSSEFLNRGYHNQPGKTELYQKIAELIQASHTDPIDDLVVIKDIEKDLKKFLDSI